MDHPAPDAGPLAGSSFDNLWQTLRELCEYSKAPTPPPAAWQAMLPLSKLATIGMPAGCPTLPLIRTRVTVTKVDR